MTEIFYFLTIFLYPKSFVLCPKTGLSVQYTQETHDQSLKCGEELQNQCLF